MTVTGLQVAMLGGALLGSALALLVWRLAPTDPDLADALDRLSPEYARRQQREAAETARLDGRERLGIRAMKVLPRQLWGTVPTRDLAILRMSVPRFYGEKVLFAALGLVIPTFITTIYTLLGLQLPLVLPVIGTVGLAVLMWFLPNWNAIDDARKAREEFTRALIAYIELVALKRLGGAQPRSALEDAAARAGGNWVFARLGEELSMSRLLGEPGWGALVGLADELGIPELDDLAMIMRTSTEDGAQVYDNLRARANAMRSAMLSDEVSKANAASERMYVPMSLLGVIFMLILIAPQILRVWAGSN